MWWIAVSSVAWGQQSDARFPDPNVVVGLGAGRPGLVTIRAEAWLAGQFSAEIGFGLDELGFDRLAADLTFRARPNAFCVGCGGQNLLAVGVGAAAVASAPSDFETWAIGIGPDVVVTGVHWFTRELGVQVSVRGGAGPRLDGPDVTIEAVDWWSFGTVGLSF